MMKTLDDWIVGGCLLVIIGWCVWYCAGVL